MVRPTHDYYRNVQMLKGSRGCAKRQTEANTIIDVGAALGSCSLCAEEFWPRSDYVLFELLAERKAEFKVLSLSKKDFYFILAAAGKERG